VLAALSISAPAFRYEEHEAEYTRAVLEGARRISERIGYTGYGNQRDHEMEGLKS
jgi:DNA-binding IclR family transcriptional regulator